MLLGDMGLSVGMRGLTESNEVANWLPAKTWDCAPIQVASQLRQLRSLRKSNNPYQKRATAPKCQDDG